MLPRFLYKKTISHEVQLTNIIIIVIIIIIIIIIIGSPGTSSKSFRKYPSNIQKSTKSRSYRKQSYRALHTHFGKY
jgi:FtsZ-interacting cell division protein ZipA